MKKDNKLIAYTNNVAHYFIIYKYDLDNIINIIRAVVIKIKTWTVNNSLDMGTKKNRSNDF